MRLTHRALRAACLEAADAYSGRLEQAAEDGPTPALSPALAAGLPALRRQAHRQQALHRTMQSAAAFFLMVLLGCATVAAVPEARAAVLSWVGTRSHGSIVYQFSGEGSTLPEYALTWLPEGFAQTGGHRSSESAYAFYTDESGNRLYISYSLMHEGQAISFPGQGRLLYVENLTVNGLAGQYIHMVQLETRQNEVLIWFDENRNIVFNITSTLGKEDMLRIAENMVSAEKSMNS